MAMEKIISKNIPLDPTLFILGLYPKQHRYSRKEKIIIDLCLLYAKRSVAMHWKNMNKPSFIFWVKQMMSFLPLEKVTYIKRGKGEMFEEIWGPVAAYVKNMNIVDEDE